MATVLHVLEAVRGGTSRHVADIVASTPRHDHHVVVPGRPRPEGASGAAVDVAAVEVMREQGATIHGVGMRRSATHPTNLVAAARLAHLIGTVRPDVVHGHSSVGGALARVATAGRAPVAYTPNGLAPGPVAVRLERALGKVTTTLIAVSDSEARLAARLRLVPPERIRVIPNGIALEQPAGTGVDLRAELGLPAGTPLIGTIARLVPQKAPADFVAVAAEVHRLRPDTHTLLIGMGPQQGLVNRRVRETGLDGFFHQIAGLPQAAAVLDQLDVFVLPSRFEGAPYTPLEAMRAEVPVVLSDAVGNVDAVEDGVSGRLCPVGDTAAMARAVVDLLDNGDRRRAMTSAAARRLATEFDLEATARDLSDLYDQLAAGNSPAAGTRPRATLRR